MSQAKRKMERLQRIYELCVSIATQVNAIEQDPETDEITSNRDQEADDQAYATARTWYNERRFDGTWDEVSKAMSNVLS